MALNNSKHDNQNSIAVDNEKQIVSFACGRTYTLISETHIHAHPVNQYYPSTVYPYLMARANGGFTDFLYKVDAYIELNPLDKAKVDSLPAKYDSVKKYINRRMNKLGFKKAPTPYRFYLLEPIHKFVPAFSIKDNNEKARFYTFAEVGLNTALC